MEDEDDLMEDIVDLTGDDGSRGRNSNGNTHKKKPGVTPASKSYFF